MRVNLLRETFAICSFLCQGKLQVKEHFQQSTYKVSFSLKVSFGLIPLICIFLLITLLNQFLLSLFICEGASFNIEWIIIVFSILHHTKKITYLYLMCILCISNILKKKEKKS